MPYVKGGAINPYRVEAAAPRKDVQVVRHTTPRTSAYLRMYSNRRVRVSEGSRVPLRTGVWIVAGIVRNCVVRASLKFSIPSPSATVEHTIAESHHHTSKGALVVNSSVVER